VETPQDPVSIRASDDPQAIERGRYLVHGPAHCAGCHGDPSRQVEIAKGHEIPLSGGKRFNLGLLGTVVAPNITSDPEAGIGALSDDTLVHSLRYGMSHEGKPLVPLMPFADMADRDLQAVISYLRTVAPVSTPAPQHELSWLGSLAVRFLVGPAQPNETPAVAVEPERTPEYGRYLAHTVANCHGCHTRRSKLTGAFVGPAFAGGMEIQEGDETFVAPNLTPEQTSVLHDMSEQQFIERFQLRGQIELHSPMPWGAYSRMTESDLAAIYRYLTTVPASKTPT
jgi:mono/diheme cytochrome c family protein